MSKFFTYTLVPWVFSTQLFAADTDSFFSYLNDEPTIGDFLKIDEYEEADPLSYDVKDNQELATYFSPLELGNVQELNDEKPVLKIWSIPAPEYRVTPCIIPMPTFLPTPTPLALPPMPSMPWIFDYATAQPTLGEPQRDEQLCQPTLAVLPVSDSPVLMAFLHGILRKIGGTFIDKSAGTIRIDDFTALNDYMEKVCSKQKVTRSSVNRIKSLKRWFSGWPNGRERQKEYTLTLVKNKRTKYKKWLLKTEQL